MLSAKNSIHKETVAIFLLIFLSIKLKSINIFIPTEEVEEGKISIEDIRGNGKQWIEMKLNFPT